MKKYAFLKPKPICIGIALLLLFSITLSSTTTVAKDYIVYSIMQEIPMGQPNEVIKKNFFVNIGASAGVKKGTLLNVYRGVSAVDPYQSKNRYYHKVLIGRLKILHAEADTSIAKLDTLFIDDQTPMFEINGLMIGDTVDVDLTST